MLFDKSFALVLMLGITACGGGSGGNGNLSSTNFLSKSSINSLMSSSVKSSTLVSSSNSVLSSSAPSKASSKSAISSSSIANNSSSSILQTSSVSSQTSPPHVVGECSKLGAVGVWENITPPGTDLSEFGVSSVDVAPHDSAILYVGTQHTGLFKSPDCGATWTKLNTGTLGPEMNPGTILPVIDPIDPNVIYASSLYGPNGLFKSENGGVDWKQILSEEVVKYAPYGGFIGGTSMDPNDHLHLLVAWHAVCVAPYNALCYAETKDGGKTWTLRNGEAFWQGGEGASLQFLDSKTWLFSSQSNGMWRSVDEGKTWTQLSGVTVSHGAGQLYHASSGAYFLGSATGVLYSPDGATWSLVPNSGNNVSGVAGDGTSVWTGSAYPYNKDSHPAPFYPYLKATEAAPTTWTTLQSPALSSGGSRMTYDPDHKVLYSANHWDGIWRVVVK
jgi:hypothetical protein